MANIYTWTVDSMLNYPSYAGQTDVVTTVNWICVGTDGTYSGRLAGATGITYNPADPFIPYSNLTNDIVIGWVKETLGIDGVASIQADIDGQISTQTNPQQNNPLPWG